MSFSGASEGLGQVHGVAANVLKHVHGVSLNALPLLCFIVIQVQCFGCFCSKTKERTGSKFHLKHQYWKELCI